MEKKQEYRHPIFDGVQMGVGTWAWGDRLIWDFGRGYTENDLKAIFDICTKAGLYFFDTAEVYGQGKSEIFLGKFIDEYNSQKAGTKKIIIASKFMPYPWRLGQNSLLKAVRSSLKRLELASIDLYQIHLPLPPIAIETWMERMVDIFQSGLISAVGVSNYNRQQMQRAYDTLGREGIPLASNQVEYNLLNRTIEKNGLIRQCHELGVTIIAYSPLAMGILSGKYSPNSIPQGLRSRRYNRKKIEQIQPLIHLLHRVGSAHAGKTAAQVAINWTLCKGTLPIPGSKNINQAEQNIGALGWRLTAEEVNLLDRASDKILDNQ